MTEFLTTLVNSFWNEAEIFANAVVFLNILGALLLGLIVGYERTYHGRAAGMRTYGMVCMASCALTVIDGHPELWFGGMATYQIPVDPSRTIQGIVTGIGFLGAGVIMRDGLNISGLTTAASIWACAAIGVLVGVGFYGAAILLSALSAIFMMWGSRIESFLPSRHAITVTLRFRESSKPTEHSVCQMMRDLGYEVALGSFSITEHGHRPEWRFVAISIGRKRSVSLINLSHTLAEAKDIDTYHLAHARN